MFFVVFGGFNHEWFRVCPSGASAASRIAARVYVPTETEFKQLTPEEQRAFQSVGVTPVADVNQTRALPNRDRYPPLRPSIQKCRMPRKQRKFLTLRQHQSNVKE